MIITSNYKHRRTHDVPASAHPTLTNFNPRCDIYLTIRNQTAEYEYQPHSNAVHAQLNTTNYPNGNDYFDQYRQTRHNSMASFKVLARQKSLLYNRHKSISTILCEKIIQNTINTQTNCRSLKKAQPCTAFYTAKGKLGNPLFKMRENRHSISSISDGIEKAICSIKSEIYRKRYAIYLNNHNILNNAKSFLDRNSHKLNHNEKCHILRLIDSYENIIRNQEIT